MSANNRQPQGKSGKQNQPGPPPARPLTRRECEVLGLIMDGLTNRQIAEQLVLSPETVKVHIRNIYRKLKVHNRRQATHRARAFGKRPTLD